MEEHQKKWQVNDRLNSSTFKHCPHDTNKTILLVNVERLSYKELTLSLLTSGKLCTSEYSGIMQIFSRIATQRVNRILGARQEINRVLYCMLSSKAICRKLKLLRSLQRFPEDLCSLFQHPFLKELIITSLASSNQFDS